MTVPIINEMIAMYKNLISSLLKNLIFIFLVFKNKLLTSLIMYKINFNPIVEKIMYVIKKKINGIKVTSNLICPRKEEVNRIVCENPNLTA
jgi:hypothetical protein